MIEWGILLKSKQFTFSKGLLPITDSFQLALPPDQGLNTPNSLD